MKNIEWDRKLFDEVICIATSKQVEEKIKQALKEKNLIDKKIIIPSVLSFP
jgi:hypothetical protein